MKHPQFKINKNKKLKIKHLKSDISEIIEDALLDIKPYLVKDVLIYLKKKGVIYEKKNKAKITKKTKKTKK